MSYDLGTAHGKIVLEYDSDRAVGRAERDIDKLERKAKEGNGTLGKLGKTLGAVGKAAKLGGLAVTMIQAAAGASSLLIQVAGIVPQLASIASLSAALPGLFVAMSASALTLKAAFAGVGDAVTAAFDTEHPEKFDKAIKDLAPAAQEFAKAIRNVAPQLKNFQKEIQQAFFQASFLAQQVPRLAKAMATLRPTVLGLASEFGEAARRVSNFALSADSISFLNNVIKATRAAFSEASSAIIPVLTGLRDVGGVGIPLLVRLGELIGQAGQKFGAWLTEIARSGQLQEWINTAVATLKTLGGILGNVGSILSSVFQAAADTGGGLLNTIETITGEFARFLKSAEGSAAIRDLFSAIMQVARALAPVITTLVGALAKALAPAISRIATEVGPVLLEVVEALAPAFGPLAAAIADLVTAVAPLLPPIAKLTAILAGVLSTAVQAITRELGPLLEVLGEGLSEAFEQLTPLIGEMAKGLPLAAEAGLELAKAFAPLMPLIVELAATLADSLIEVMPELRDAVREILPVIVQFANLLAGELGEALVNIIKLLPFLIQAWAKLAPIMLQIQLIGIRLATWFLQLVNFVERVIPALGRFATSLQNSLVGALSAAYNGVVSAGAAVIDWFQKLPGRLLDLLKALPGAIGSLFTNALKAAATAVGFGAGLVVGFFTKLLPAIINAIIALPGKLWDLMKRAWDAAVRATSAGYNAVLNFFKNLPSRTRAALSSIGSSLSTIFRNALNSARNAVNSGVNTVLSFFRNLPGRIRSALGSLGSLLYNSGVNIINGLINGINRGIGRVLGMVSDLASRVKNSFNNALSIFSPSREFKWSGEMIGEGLIKGLRAKLQAVRKTAEVLAATVIRPTVALPQTASATLNTVAPAAVRRVDATAAGRTFGPYQMELDGRVVAEFVVDTVTGNPKVVSKAAAEGDRRITWTGSGRKVSAA